MSSSSNVAERSAKYAGGLANTALDVAVSSGLAWFDLAMNFQREMQRVATRTVQGETTRLRRRVIAQPVEQQVTLREEKVIVERRPSVPDADLKSLTTMMHISRRGALAPFEDGHDDLSQTKQSLDQVVRERAYCLWQQEGCPEGRPDEYWHRAHDQHLRERAYCLWQQEGCPEGRADEYWHRTREFETH